jgi:hypothetical protein
MASGSLVGVEACHQSAAAASAWVAPQEVAAWSPILRVVTDLQLLAALPICVAADENAACLPPRMKTCRLQA